MGRKGGNPDGLVNFKKGKDERRNISGANAGSQSLKSILDRLLTKKIAVEDLEGLTIKVTAKEAIALNMIALAATDEDPNIMLKAAKQVFEHTDAIVKEVKMDTNLSIEGESELTPENAAKLRKLLQGE